MGTGLFIFLIIIAIIILVGIVVVLWRMSTNALEKRISIELGDFCSTTSNCPFGLQCEQGKCLIPSGGSCVLFPDRCVSGNTCYKGRCVPLLTTTDEDLYTKFINNTGQNEINIIPISDFENDSIISPFTSINIINQSNNEISSSIYQGHILDTSTNMDVIKEIPNNGIWLITTTGKLSYIDSNSKIHSINFNDDILLSCLVLDNVCYVLCKNNILYAAAFNEKIIYEKLNFPTTFNDNDIDAGECINLGKSSSSTLMIIMSNGIWMSNKHYNWSWIPHDNSNTVYMSFINGKKLIMYSDNTYKYGKSSGTWDKLNYPHINSNNEIEMVNYWSKGILALS